MTGAPPRRFPPFQPQGQVPKRAPPLAPPESVRRMLADPELLAHLSDVVSVLDAELRFLYVSRSVTRPLTSLVAHSMLDVLAPQERTRVRDACLQTLATGTPQLLLALDADGRLWESRLVRAHDGTQPLLFMSSTDVSERAHAEHQRHEQESRLRAAFESSGVGTFSWDLDRDELLWDAGLFGILGRDPAKPPDDYVDYLDYVHPDDRARVARQVEVILETGTFNEFEHRLLRPDGELRHVVCRGTVLRHADARIHSIRGGVVDVTVRERLDAQQRHVAKMEAVGQLTAGIAHNFNNLLSVALPNLELCRARAPHDLRQPLADVLHAVTRASELVRQLMRFARQEPPGERERAQVDLGAIAHRTAQICSATFGRGIVVSTEVEPGLPAVRARAGDIEQVLLNVCINARDALHEADTEHQRVAIRVALGDDGRSVQVRIADNGPGVDEAVRARMFEPFFTTKEVHRGTGLGLATAYGIVSDHEGTIRCESTPGAGCTFVIDLPVASAPMSVAAATGRIERVLLIDDEAPVRRALRAVLEGHGFEVLEAGDGSEGLSVLAREARIDAIVLDRSMPHVSGDEFLATLRGDARRVPILLLTGNAGDEPERHDVAAVVLKPVRAGELLRAVRQAIDRSQIGAAGLQTGDAR
ncbi:MAG: ATP-binding protein [Polyangiales bacterium]